ncbi:hypothetical protein [Clostridium sp.]
MAVLMGEITRAFFVFKKIFKKIQEKKKAQEAEKPDPDADSAVDEDDNEPV